MRVLAVSGSSGGHIFPAVSVLEELKRRQSNIETLLVLPKKCSLNKSNFPGQNVKFIPYGSVSLRPDLKNLRAFWEMLKGGWESLFIIIFFRPDVIIGFGSLASLPLIFWGWLFRISTIIHEQNVIPGRANRLMAYFAGRIAVSFNATKTFLRDFQDKIVLTGNPLRGNLRIVEKKEALRYFGLKEDKFTILIMGGSQGSRRINQEIAKVLFQSGIAAKVQVIHLAGSGGAAGLEPVYQRFNIDRRLFDFLEPMEYAYSAADLVLSRAGAATITELIFFAKPAILMPYPYAYRHQQINARVLQEQGCAILSGDEDLENGVLIGMLKGLIGDPARISAMSGNYAVFPGNNSRALLAQEILNS